MAFKLRTPRPDAILRQIVAVLREYEKAHPEAEIEVYRHSSVSVRIRIISKKFAGLTRGQREKDIWALLDTLSEETLSEVSLLLLFTPAEAKKSFANAEFDDPIPSKL